MSDEQWQSRWYRPLLQHVLGTSFSQTSMLVCNTICLSLRRNVKIYVPLSHHLVNTSTWGSQWLLKCWRLSSTRHTWKFDSNHPQKDHRSAWVHGYPEHVQYSGLSAINKDTDNGTTTVTQTMAADITGSTLGSIYVVTTTTTVLAEVTVAIQYNQSAIMQQNPLSNAAHFKCLPSHKSISQCCRQGSFSRDVVGGVAGGGAGDVDKLA